MQTIQCFDDAIYVLQCKIISQQSKPTEEIKAVISHTVKRWRYYITHIKKTVQCRKKYDERCEYNNY